MPNSPVALPQNLDWQAFADPQRYWHYGVVLLAATLSGALLAYHPVHRRRSATVDDLEVQKTIIVYAVVGALIAVICTVSASMAFVIFGIGGLLRFRTEVGASKLTGHTIIATLVGLSWGLGQPMVGVLATAYFWLMIYVLERTVIAQVNVGGVAIADMARTSEAYRQVFERSACRLSAQHKDFKRQQLQFVLRMPQNLGLDELEKRIDEIPSELRGTPHITS